MNSRRWWWTGRPGLPRFMGSQRVGHDWVTELNWTEYFHCVYVCMHACINALPLLYPFGLLSCLDYCRWYRCVRWGYMYLLEVVFLFSLVRCPEVALLDHTVVPFVIFWGASILFSVLAASGCFPTGSAWGFRFLHILASICWLLFFWWWLFWQVGQDTSLWLWCAFLWRLAMLSACWPSVCLLLWRGGRFSPLPISFFCFAIEVYEHFNKSLRKIVLHYSFIEKRTVFMLLNLNFHPFFTKT